MHLLIMTLIKWDNSYLDSASPDVHLLPFCLDVERYFSNRAMFVYLTRCKLQYFRPVTHLSLLIKIL